LSRRHAHHGRADSGRSGVRRRHAAAAVRRSVRRLRRGSQFRRECRRHTISDDPIRERRVGAGIPPGLRLGTRTASGTAAMKTLHTAAWLTAMVAMTIGVAPAERVSAQSSPIANAQIEVAIRDTLRQYSTALEHLDADAVKTVQPSIEVENLR